MRPATLLLVLVPAITTAAAPPAGVRVDLLRYYANQDHPPAWQAAVKRLGDPDRESRARAADYLLTLLAQAREDERIRQEPWETEPYRRDVRPAPAHQLRSQVADELAKSRLLPEGERVLHWFLEEELDPELQEAILPALEKLSGRSARTLSLALISRPHPNAAVVIAALDLLRRGKTPVPAEVLDALCNHPRASIREAARRLHKELGRPEHKPFNPAATMRSRRVRDLLQQLRALMSEPPPVEKKFVRVRFLLPGESEDDEDPLDFRGWLLRDTNEEAEVLIVAGKRWNRKKPVPMPGVRPEVQGRWIIRAVKIEEEVLRLEQAHRERLASLQEVRPEARFDSDLVDWDSLVFAWWLDARGRPADAARVLLPVLDGVHRDEDLLCVARSHRGFFLGMDMLDAFIGDHDYPRTEEHARVITTRFAGTRFHAHARRLLAELPLRREDFRTLKLPTAAEWARLRATLPREAQLDYLCSRLRLLNCFRVWRPGIDLTQPQYAEARKCSLYGWFFLLPSTPKEVINPLKELTDLASATRVRLADVPHLARYLADDWTMLALTDGMLTAPGYDLLSTRPALADVINGLARRDICRLDRWTNLSVQEREREIARIAAWARANAGKTEVQLEWQALSEDVRADADWYTVQPRLAWLLARKQHDGLTVLHAYLLDARTPPAARADILKLYDQYDPVEAAAWRKVIPSRLRTR